MADAPKPNRPPFGALFTMLGLAIGLLARDAIDTYGGGQDALPRPARAAVAAAAPDDPPVEVEVRAVLELPTATPTPRPEPTATPRPVLTPAAVTCGMTTQAAGEVCRMPASTPTPTPTLPACWSEAAADGELCMIRPTATGVPTTAPPPAPPTGG